MRSGTNRAAAAVLISLALIGPAKAGIDDYEFRLLERKVKMGAPSVVAVRLVDKRTGSPVSDAVIFARRIDMAPDGMGSMTAALAPRPSSEPGVYRFETDLTMAGGWQLSLAAKVQGEIGTVLDKLILRAVR